MFEDPLRSMSSGELQYSFLGALQAYFFLLVGFLGTKISADTPEELLARLRVSS